VISYPKTKRPAPCKDGILAITGSARIAKRGRHHGSVSASALPTRYVLSTLSLGCAGFAGRLDRLPGLCLGARGTECVSLQLGVGPARSFFDARASRRTIEARPGPTSWKRRVHATSTSKGKQRLSAEAGICISISRRPGIFGLCLRLGPNELRSFNARRKSQKCSGATSKAPDVPLGLLDRLTLLAN